MAFSLRCCTSFPFCLLPGLLGLALACSRPAAPPSAETTPPASGISPGRAGSDSASGSPRDARPNDSAAAEPNPTSGDEPSGVRPLSAPGKKRIFLAGHSLINRRMPGMLAGIADADPELDLEVGLQILIGAALIDQWNDAENPAKVADSGFKRMLRLAKYDAMVITERVPIAGESVAWGGACHGAQIYNFAYQTNPEIQFYVLETWIWTNDPDGERFGNQNWVDRPRWQRWRERIDLDWPSWKSFAQSIYSGNYPPWPAQGDRPDCPRIDPVPQWKPITLIPGGQALAALYDELQRGPVGDLRTMSEIFDDEIHLNDTGNYFLAAVVFAKVFGRDPRGLGPDVKKNGDFWNYQPPSKRTGLELERIAWEVVQKTANR